MLPGGNSPPGSFLRLWRWDTASPELTWIFRLVEVASLSHENRAVGSFYRTRQNAWSRPDLRRYTPA